MMQLSAQAFDEALADALDDVPADLLAMLDNVVFLVEDEPGPDHGDPDLLGIYEGVPLPERHDAWGGPQLPDRITVFRGPLFRLCADEVELRDELRVTVIHEIAHHVGIDDERLTELGWD